MSSYSELRSLVEQAWSRDRTITEVLGLLQGEQHLAALGKCIADVYGTLRWGEANHLISVFCEPNAPLRLRVTPVPISDQLQRLATQRPQEARTPTE